MVRHFGQTVMSPAVLLLAWITFFAHSVFPQGQQPDVASSSGATAGASAQATFSMSGSLTASQKAATTFMIVSGTEVSSAAATSSAVVSNSSSVAPAVATATLVVSNHTNPLYTYNYTSGIKINNTSPGVNNSFSPPFYPSPETRGKGNWTFAVEKARSFVAQLTLEEKVNLTTGVGWTGGRCVGNIPAIERVGFDGLCLEDAPLGVRFADGVSAFPSGLNAAATFDRQLMYERALAIGEEFRGKGVNIALGPGMNGGGRLAASGEFSSAPFEFPAYARCFQGDNGRWEVETLISLANPPTTPSRVFKMLEYKPVPSTTSSTNRNEIGRRAVPTSMMRRCTKFTCTRS